ncbi:MAG: TIGR04290 family methyltransferase [Ignavibacteria bacterium]|jgi:tRNA (mo5U34)-methyltransferase|nr:TIGR04290 family methyltransferase [Ignavibacteria bacterium]MCU7502191.1 TIGR04290 family methyltransferase [Ignavibacteria bacterium]MCU7517408.1 TIGR04290 family methyltransferase [Ignavibacteria bacterium]
MNRTETAFETLETFISDPKTPLERKIFDIGPWFHNLHLPDGTQTAPNHPLGDFPSFKWEKISGAIPKSLKGWNVLDIGCNAGFYSFELARRGAYVTGIDLDGHYLRQARWAARQFGLQEKVKFRKMQIYDLAHSGTTYDMVVFMGVFYHLRYPLLALDIVAQKFKKLLLFQTLTMPGEEVMEMVDDLPIENREVMLNSGWPKMAFIENSLAGDATNWWAPNHAAVEAMLRSGGLEVVKRPDHEVYLCTHSGIEKSGNYEPEELSSAAKSVRSVITG